MEIKLQESQRLSLEFLIGRKIVEIVDNLIIKLDNGEVYKVIESEGCGGCSSGWSQAAGPAGSFGLPGAYPGKTAHESGIKRRRAPRRPSGPIPRPAETVLPENGTQSPGRRCWPGYCVPSGFGAIPP